MLLMPMGSIPIVVDDCCRCRCRRRCCRCCCCSCCCCWCRVICRSACWSLSVVVVVARATSSSSFFVFRLSSFSFMLLGRGRLSAFALCIGLSCLSVVLCCLGLRRPVQVPCSGLNPLWVREAAGPFPLCLCLPPSADRRCPPVAGTCGAEGTKDRRRRSGLCCRCCYRRCRCRCCLWPPADATTGAAAF